MKYLYVFIEFDRKTNEYTAFLYGIQGVPCYTIMYKGHSLKDDQ